MIERLLVANRAEIASRVFRTCRELGIETVAIHSDADAGLPYVHEADHVVRLPGNAPAETYLRADLVIARTARAHAAWRGAAEIDSEDIRVAAELALPHRRRRDPRPLGDVVDGGPGHAVIEAEVGNTWQLVATA